MADANDMDLVRKFARQNSETAFAELVRRHLNLVYSVALRYTGHDGDAQDVTQDVFILLVRKAARLSDRTVLTGWLYETTRFTASRLLRTHARRRAYEQKATMQSTLDSSDNDSLWHQFAPHLEAAMSRLAERDRTLLALRFYENKTGAEAAALLGIREETAHKRTARALEKLRQLFAKRGISSTAAMLAGAISANSMQAAPVGLAKTISAVAVAKGAAASSSTLTLIKGALKLMAWTKMKTAVVAGAAVLLAAGTTTVTIREIEGHHGYQWQVQADDLSAVLEQAPPMVKIVPTRFSKQPIHFTSGVFKLFDGGNIKRLQFDSSVESMIFDAYNMTFGFHFGSTRAILPALPQERYDYIACLPKDSSAALVAEIKRKFGLVARVETIETNVLFLVVKHPKAQGLKLSSTDSNRIGRSGDSIGGDSGLGWYNSHSVPLSYLANYCEGVWQTPVIDRTGLTNNYDLYFKWQRKNGETGNEAIKQAMLDQFGLDLVPGRAPIEMLVVEKVK